MAEPRKGEEGVPDGGVGDEIGRCQKAGHPSVGEDPRSGALRGLQPDCRRGPVVYDVIAIERVDEWHGKARVLAEVMYGRLRGPSALRQSTCPRGAFHGTASFSVGVASSVRGPLGRMSRVHRGLFCAGCSPRSAKILMRCSPHSHGTKNRQNGSARSRRVASCISSFDRLVFPHVHLKKAVVGLALWHFGN